MSIVFVIISNSLYTTIFHGYNYSSMPWFRCWFSWSMLVNPRGCDWLYFRFGVELFAHPNMASITGQICWKSLLNQPVLGDYVFSSFLCPPLLCLPLQQRLLFLTSKPFVPNLRYLEQRKFKSENVLYDLPMTLTQGHSVRTTSLTATKFVSNIPLAMLITW